VIPVGEKTDNGRNKRRITDDAPLLFVVLC
jgi:hypothetical protein